MRFQVTLTREKIVYVNALDKDDLMFKLEKYENAGWNYEHAREEAN